MRKRSVSEHFIDLLSVALIPTISLLFVVNYFTPDCIKYSKIRETDARFSAFLHAAQGRKAKNLLFDTAWIIFTRKTGRTWISE